MKLRPLLLAVVLFAIANLGCSGIATVKSTSAPVAPSITTQPAGQTVSAGQTASFSVVAGGPAPLTYQWKKNGTAISGANAPGYTTPPTTTSDNGGQFNVAISNAAGTVTSNIAMLTVNPASASLQITTTQLPDGLVSGPYSSSVSATGGASPYSWSVSSGTLPTGLGLSSSGAISGTPTVAGSYPFTVAVKDAASASASKSLSITVSAASASLQITTTQLPDGLVSGPYSSSVSATGGASPYSWSVSSGTLPTGLSLSSSGAISGTPTVAGSYPFTVAVKDAASASASKSLGITVATAAPPAVSISSPANGATVSGTVVVSGVASDGVAISSVQLSVDAGAFTTVSGTSNWSYSLNSNSLSNGSHSLSAKVNDSAGKSATSSLVDFTVNNASTSTDCTLFASPSGSSSNSGTSPSAPKSFSAAAAASVPGSVVCLLGGTYNLSSSFNPPNSGSPSSWIVYKNYDTTPVNFVWTGAADASAMFRFNGGGFPSNPAYLEFRGFNLNGNGNAADGFFCRGSHHLRFIGNSISNTGGSGIASIDCDYLTADHNLINHNGYIPAGTANPQWYSWTSAISFNSNQWFDSYPGFHNIIANNIIAGEVDQSSNHTDGNGIILDLSNGSYTPSTANTPPALIVNNLVYGNGGACVVAFVVTNFWMVNNTCFKNDLDTSEANFGSFVPHDSHDGYIINNIAVAYSSGHPPYAQSGTVTNVTYFADLYFGSTNNFSYSDPSQFIQADPLFLNPPSLGANQYSSALAPSLLSNALSLLPLSPAFNRGIDPSSISGLNASLVSDLKKYIYADINGKSRPQGGGVDLGAVQH
jgi:hypothetical protein